ncbi:type VI secretion system baseplate subunit TssG, partial [Enterococcus faecium]
YKRIERLTALYLHTPVKCRLVLSLKPDQQRGTRLGDGWQRLGTNTWLGRTLEQGEAVFTLVGAQGPGTQSQTGE